MRKTIFIAIVALLIAAVAAAQPAPAGTGKFLAGYLQLTPDQITAWQQINKDTAAAVKPLAANAKDLRGQLKTALSAATPDEAAIGRLAVSLHAVQDQIRAARQDGQNKRLAVLTADQRTKLDAVQAAMKFMRQQRRPAR